MQIPKYIEFFHNNPSITTLEGFINFHFLKDITPETLLVFEDNQASIVKSYFPADGTVALTTLLRPGTSLKVPTESVDRETISTNNNITYNKNFSAFLSEKMKSIVNNTGYIPLADKQGVEALGDFFRLYNNVTVWIWCKALTGGNKGQLLNLTPFIEDVSTSQAKSGGTFALQLAPILGVFDKTNGWVIDEATIYSYVNEANLSDFASRANVNYLGKDNQFKRSNFYFERIIQSNDIIFIKFEPLEMESKDKVNTPTDIKDSLIVSPSKIHTKVWDMIGMVDNCGNDYMAGNADVKISVVGRDLSKILQEDGVYFFPLDYARNENEYFENTVQEPTENVAISRLISGELFYFNAYIDRTIDFSIKFIFNILSSIKVCDNELFRYHDDITYRYEFYTPLNRVVEDSLESADNDVKQKIKNRNSVDEENRKTVLQKIKAPGIWQIVKLVFDDEVLTRRIVDSSITVSQGNLMSFVSKVCQDPFVEFWGDTYGSNFFFITRKPPYTKKAILSNFTVDVEDSEVYQENFIMDDADVYSWFRIVPRGNFFGSDEISLIDFPAVYLKEYMELWGSRPYNVVTNYVNYDGIAQSTAGTNLETLRKQALQDLQFVIQSHAYLPFTRKGSLALKGNRRIKVGMHIRYKPTGELFLVTSVKNNYSLNRSTTDRVTVVEVERGMVEKYVKDKDFNYFNLIEFTDNKRDGSAETYNFKVNPEVFDFFLKRKQFQ